MVNVRRLIHHGRPPSRVGAAARGATNLISGLRGTFCGSAAVVGGSGDDLAALLSLTQQFTL
jgi:hypothetical protein